MEEKRSKKAAEIEKELVVRDGGREAGRSRHNTNSENKA